MKWPDSVLIGLVLIGLAGIGAWGYAFFVAPETVDAVSKNWTLSGHADADSVAFTLWDDGDSTIPAGCAKCHSMEGYLDFLGADGSSAGDVDDAVTGGSILSCRTCHNEPAHQMTEVTFPSGVVVREPTQAANCMRCHQGLRATQDVQEALSGLETDTVYEQLEFIDVHYAIGAATLLGGDGRVGYQYDDKSYAGRFEHVEDYDTCIECHDAHSTFRNPDECSPCHLNVVNSADLRDIRVSEVDYDGDGNVDEPILDEITIFRTALYKAVQDYAADVIGEPIIYDRESSPYFFSAPDGDGTPTEEYNSWTPRLVRAAYNYHYVQVDPGGYTHNPRYILQLLYDSTEDLGQAVPVELTEFVRP